MRLFLLGLLLITITSCQTIKSSFSPGKALSEKEQTSLSKDHKNKKLVWNQNNEETNELAGYRIYLSIGQDKEYKLIKEIADPKQTSVKFSQLGTVLKYNTANHFYVTAYDNNKNESLPSNKTCWGLNCEK